MNKGKHSAYVTLDGWCTKAANPGELLENVSALYPESKHPAHPEPRH